MGPKAGKNKGKSVEPEVEEDSEDEIEEEEGEEEIGEEEVGEEEVGEEEDEEEDDSEVGEDAAMMMDEDDAIGEAVNQTMEAITALETPDEIRTVLSTVKEQIKTLLYTSDVQSMFKAVLQSESGTSPFAQSETMPAQKLFSRCSVTSHGVFRDDEYTLGPRREICGAVTTIEIANMAEDFEVPITMLWYWRHDEEEGWVEEYALTMEEEADDEEKEEEEEDEEEDDDEGPEVKIITLLEGRRSQRGETSSELNLEGLRALDTAIESGLALQSLLRFLVLTTRTECDKCKGKPSSIAEGFDEEEDAEQMRVHLCSVLIEGEEPGLGESAKTAGKKRKVGPGQGDGAKPGVKKAKKSA